MKNKLYALDYQKCANFLREYLHGWQYFTPKIIDGYKKTNGDFYSIAPSNIEDNELYEFTTAKGMSIGIPYPDDVIADVIADLINSKDESFFYIAEEVGRKPFDQFIVNSRREYYLVGSTMFYIRKKGDGQKSVIECLNYFGGYGCFSMLVNDKAPMINTKQNIDANIEKIILDHV